MAHFPLVRAARDAARTQQVAVRHKQISFQPKRGVSGRFLGALIAWHRRQAGRGIAYFLHARIGTLTDDAERGIERRFLQRSPGRL